MESLIVPGAILLVVLLLGAAVMGRANRAKAASKKKAKAEAVAEPVRMLTPEEIRRQQLVARAADRVGKRYDAKVDAELDAEIDALNAPQK